MNRLLLILWVVFAMSKTVVADDVQLSPLPTQGWRLVSDQVMGGVSSGAMRTLTRQGEGCIALQGRVSTANNGGFLQLALDIDPSQYPAHEYDGLSFEVIGNSESYNVHLRTSDLSLPWQSFRATFTASGDWSRVFLPFADFMPYRTPTGLQLPRLRRIGIVAIGRDFDVDVCIKGLALYRKAH